MLRAAEGSQPLYAQNVIQQFLNHRDREAQRFAEIVRVTLCLSVSVVPVCSIANKTLKSAAQQCLMDR